MVWNHWLVAFRIVSFLLFPLWDWTPCINLVLLVIPIRLELEGCGLRHLIRNSTLFQDRTDFIQILLIFNRVIALNACQYIYVLDSTGAQSPIVGPCALTKLYTVPGKTLWMSKEESGYLLLYWEVW